MKNILIIEDERTYANIIGELIQDEGFACTMAYSAGEAEEHFQKLGKEIHVVILDLMMSRTGTLANSPPYAGETGDELYERIRLIAPSLPIIIMTAKTMEGLKPRYTTDKNTHLFLKPITPEVIEKLVSIIKKL